MELEEHSKAKDNLENEILILENELKEFYKYQKEEMNEVILLKNEKIEIGYKLCSCQLLEHNLKREITCLRTQVASDPTKLLELIEGTRTLIEKERETIISIEKSIQEHTLVLYKQSKFNYQILKLQSVRER